MQLASLNVIFVTLVFPEESGACGQSLPWEMGHSIPSNEEEPALWQQPDVPYPMESLQTLLMYKPALSESACFQALQGWRLREHKTWPTAGGKALCFVDHYKGPAQGISFSGPTSYPIRTIPGSRDYGVSFSQHRFSCECGIQRVENCSDGACKIYGPGTRVVKVMGWKRLRANENEWRGTSRDNWIKVKRKIGKSTLTCFRNESVALYIVVPPSECSPMTNILGRLCPTECLGSSIPGSQDALKQNLNPWFEDEAIESEHQESAWIPPRKQQRHNS